MPINPAVQLYCSIAAYVFSNHLAGGVGTSVYLAGLVPRNLSHPPESWFEMFSRFLTFKSRDNKEAMVGRCRTATRTLLSESRVLGGLKA
jgi:hypothetical protein